MTQIKQEKLVFILAILYIRKYLCVFTNCLRVPGYPKISNFGYPVPEITENAQHSHLKQKGQFQNQAQCKQATVLQLTATNYQYDNKTDTIMSGLDQKYLLNAHPAAEGGNIRRKSIIFKVRTLFQRRKTELERDKDKERC